MTSDKAKPRFPRTVDPRRQELAVAFRPSKLQEEPEGDLFQALALVFAVVGLVMRTKYGNWAALMCSLVSIARRKASQKDSRSPFESTIILTIVGLVSNYIPVFMGVPRK
ncbi:hypothetical protein BKA69DRAFT_1049460 [Paraphysoderma sedebokerense]|nr:hypothetical protein BKA69DRAFT_1049460 [Paraphysoderma sedebokerense]